MFLLTNMIESNLMNPLQRFLLWLTSKPPEPVSLFKQSMLKARQAQYAEHYAEALTALDTALEIAITEKNIAAQVDIILSKADIYLYQQKYDESEKLLTELRQRTEAASQRAPLAYTLCSLGILAQTQGNDAEARHLYERARSLAHAVRANGAEARAIAHLADTYLSEGNASYAIHLFREALPRLEHSGDTELQPYFQIRLAQALAQSGSETEADEVLAASLEKTTSIQQKRFQRLCHLAIGERAITRNDFPAAQQHYESALTLYPEPAPITAEYITALCHLSLAMLRQKQPTTALERAQFALQCANALADPQRIAQAQAYLGMAQNATGDHAAALNTLKNALDFYANQSQEKPLYFDLLREYALTLAASGDTSGALRTLEEMRQLAESDNLKTPVAQVYTEMGKLHERQRQLKEALEHYLEALKIYEQAGDYAAIAPLQCRIGAVREQLGQGRRALKDYEQALERLTYITDIVVRREVMLETGLAYVDYGEIESAEGFLKQALELAQQSGDKAAEVLCRTHYGRFLVLLHDIKPAITALMEAEAAARTISLTLATALQADGLAQAFAQIEDTTRALAYHAEALSAINSLQEPLWAAFFKMTHAHTLLQMDHFDDAKSLFENALAEGQHLKHPHIIIRALTGLALIDLHNNQPAEAGSKLAEAMKLAEMSYSRRLLAEVKLAQSQYLAVTGKLEEAQAIWQESEKLLKILHLPASPPAWLPQKT